jgi:hypothetical protein
VNRPSFWTGLLVGVLIGGLTGYALGGFVATVVLVVAGAVWWSVTMFVLVGIGAALGWRWLWTRRPDAGHEG